MQAPDNDNAAKAPGQIRTILSEDQIRKIKAEAPDAAVTLPHPLPPRSTRSPVSHRRSPLCHSLPPSPILRLSTPTLVLSPLSPSPSSPQHPLSTRTLVVLFTPHPRILYRFTPLSRPPQKNPQKTRPPRPPDQEPHKNPNQKPHKQERWYWFARQTTSAVAASALVPTTATMD